MNDESDEHITLDDAAERVHRLRTVMLLGSDCGEGLSPYAEQHYLAALASLEQAQCSLRLASLHEARWLGDAMVPR